MAVPAAARKFEKLEGRCFVNEVNCSFLKTELATDSEMLADAPRLELSRRLQCGVRYETAENSKMCIKNAGGARTKTDDCAGEDRLSLAQLYFLC